MEKRDYYYLKEVILGLRKEYLKNEQELNKLAQQICYIDKRIERVSFSLFEPDNKKIELWRTIIFKQNQIQRLIEKVSRMLGLYTIGDNSKLCCPDNKGMYSLTDRGFLIGIKDQDCFGKAVNDLMNSEFNQKIKQPIFNIDNEEADCNISITHSRIGSYEISDRGKIPYSSLDYFASEDALYFYPYHNNGSVTDIDNILNIKVSKDLLSNYHKMIIEKSGVIGRPVFVDFNIEKKKPTVLDIEDYGTQFVLVRNYEKSKKIS